jgi:hypothetical protein
LSTSSSPGWCLGPIWRNFGARLGFEGYVARAISENFCQDTDLPEPRLMFPEADYFSLSLPSDRSRFEGGSVTI